MVIGKVTEKRTPLQEYCSDRNMFEGYVKGTQYSDLKAEGKIVEDFISKTVCPLGYLSVLAQKVNAAEETNFKSRIAYALSKEAAKDLERMPKPHDRLVKDVFLEVMRSNREPKLDKNNVLDIGKRKIPMYVSQIVPPVPRIFYKDNFRADTD